MTDFLDLAPGKGKFTIDGHDVDIFALSLRRITLLGQRFEKLQALADRPIFEIIKTVGPEAVGAIIAAGLGKADDPKYEAKAADLPFGLQVEMIDAIVRLSTPGGDGPLAKALLELVNLFVPVLTAQLAIAAASSPSSLPSESPSLPANGADQKPSGT